MSTLNEASEHESEDAPSSDTDDVSDGAEYIEYVHAFEDSTGQVFTLEVLQEELLVVPQGMTATLVNASDQNRLTITAGRHRLYPIY